MIRSRSTALAALAAAALALTGCVERRLTIGSNPSGALLMVNDQEVGHTPVTVPFTWYGDYDLRFRYEVNVGTPEKPDIKRYYLHTHKYTPIPWFETIPMDMFAELLPFTFHDDQVWGFAVPDADPPTDDTATGVRGRLIKLGFACAPEGDWSPDLAKVLRDFQLSMHLDPSGEFNEATKLALKDAELLQRAQQLKGQLNTGTRPAPR